MQSEIHRKKVLLFLNLTGLALFLSMASTALQGKVPSFDKVAAASFASLHTPFLDRFFVVTTHLNGMLAVLLVSIAVSMLLIGKRRWKALKLYLFTIITAAMVASLLKLFICRERPKEGLLDLSSYAFPSWHATLSATLALIVYTLFVSKIRNGAARIFFGLFLLFWPMLIGFSRIYLNLHWSSDVLGGWGLGLFIATGSVLLFDISGDNGDG
ncbi:phosphatase PAP2 family protein [Hydrogenimonas cancrithermarum]|uniref:Phosphatidylglycerophosphatase B n=1 Tax=Hydrogenimonas cancrithermarum TaxID=2993563 RepID=A0ABM8FKB6_9BACT|nr:phosphatase PAP2 family protein [Hydrogenimonas cancrithermarum]BDY11811.1 phosphatidylglycerophosphatase B [Hydrogenimonas cancrithermarum]